MQAVDDNNTFGFMYWLKEIGSVPFSEFAIGVTT